MHVFQCSNVIFIRSFGTCFDAPVHLCKLNTCCPVTPAYGPEQAFGRGIQRNSRCISCLFSVIWMWWCVGSRAAANTYLPEGSSELACLIAVCCLLWSAWFGVNAMSRRDWEKVIKSNVFFCVCSLQSSALIHLVHTPVADSAKGSSSEGLWQDLSLNQTCQPTTEYSRLIAT